MTMLPANTTANYQQRLAFTTTNCLLSVYKKVTQGGFEPTPKWETK
jgi:hypothetical protein